MRDPAGDSVSAEAVKRIKDVVSNGESGCSCSEAVLAAYSGAFGLTRGTAIRIAAGFGGGIGLRGDICGALTAACMVLGLAFGTNDLADGYSRQRTYMIVDEFMERFLEREGTLECRNLCVGHNMSTPEGVKALRASGRPQEIILSAAQILEELLATETPG